MIPEDEQVEAKEGDDEEEGEFDLGWPNTMSGPEGEVFLHPDAGAFCEAHEAQAIMFIHGTVWLLPEEGGDWYDVQDHKKRAGRRRLRSVQ